MEAHKTLSLILSTLRAESRGSFHSCKCRNTEPGTPSAPSPQSDKHGACLSLQATIRHRDGCECKWVNFSSSPRALGRERGIIFERNCAHEAGFPFWAPPHTTLVLASIDARRRWHSTKTITKNNFNQRSKSAHATPIVELEPPAPPAQRRVLPTN